MCVAQVFREPAISIILADATHERTLGLYRALCLRICGTHARSETLNHQPQSNASCLCLEALSVQSRVEPQRQIAIVIEEFMRNKEVHGWREHEADYRWNSERL